MDKAQDINNPNYEQFNAEMYLGPFHTSMVDALAIFAKKHHHRRLQAVY